jgi:hypothetical protein
MDSTVLQLIQTVVVAAGAVGASTIAVLAIQANREIARNRATLDYIERTESTAYYQEISKTFHSFRSNPKGFSDILNPADEPAKQLRRAVVQYINHYENLSIAIQFGTLSEEMYYRAFRGALVADWELAEPFITHLRTTARGPIKPSPRAFVEFEWLARRWQGTEASQGHIEIRRNRLTRDYVGRAHR